MSKLPKEKYIRIPLDVFKGWITEIMKQPEMRFASPEIVAKEMEEQFGGRASSHLHKMRGMRLKMEDFLTKEHYYEKINKKNRKQLRRKM